MREAEQEAAKAAVTAHGTIRITTSIHFGTRKVAPAIAGFQARHPQVKFDVQLSDRIVDLVEEGFDLAIRIGGAGGENLVARPLGETRLVVCASPAYLARHGTPAVPQDLARHNCITYEYAAPRNRWPLRGPDGAGIAFEPDFIVEADLRAGRLVALLPGYAAPRSPIYAVFPTRKHLSAKVRLFVDYLVERFAAPGK